MPVSPFPPQPQPNPPSVVIIENVATHCQMSPWEQNCSGLRTICSNSCNLEQLAVSDIGNQLRLVIIACIPRIIAFLSISPSEVVFPLLDECQC